MLIAPSTLESARARRHDLELEARHERLLRLARAPLAMGYSAAAGDACCPTGCCDATVGVGTSSDRGAAAPARSLQPARRRPRPGVGGLAASLLRAVLSVRHAPRTRCAPRGAQPCAAV